MTHFNFNNSTLRTSRTIRLSACALAIYMSLLMGQKAAVQLKVAPPDVAAPAVAPTGSSYAGSGSEALPSCRRTSVAFWN